MSWIARTITDHREQMSAAKNRRPDALLTEVQRQSSMSRCGHHGAANMFSRSSEESLCVQTATGGSDVATDRTLRTSL